MKKAMSLLLALMLCVLCLPSLAEDTQVYTHPTWGFSITVPADWFCVDKTTIRDSLEASKKGELSSRTASPETLEALLPQIESTDCAVLADPYGNNIVIVREDVGIAITNEEFVELMIPALKSQLSAQIPTIQFAAEGEIVPIGDKNFINLSAEYDLGGVTAIVDMLFYLEGTYMYTLNLTATEMFGADAKNDFYQAVFDACGTFVTK